MASWEDITPLGANGKPCPQRILVGEEDGVPALRVLPDRAHAREAWWQLMFGLVFFLTPLFLIPFVTLSALPALLLSFVVGVAAVVPSLWALFGETAWKLHPSQLTVQWRIGVWRSERFIQRHAVNGLRLRPRTGRLLPLPMSCSGLLAGLLVDTVEGTRPLLMARAVVAENAAAWLASRLDEGIHVDPPEKQAIENQEDLPASEGWQESTPEHEGWGVPQRLWTRRRQNRFEIALLTLPGEHSFYWDFQLGLLSSLAGSLGMALVGLLTGQSPFSVLMGTLVGLASGMFVIAVRSFIHWIRGGRMLSKRVVIFSISPDIITVTQPRNWNKAEASINLIHAIQLADSHNWLVYALFAASLGSTFDEAVTFQWRGYIASTEVQYQLHPATAEVLAQLIHEETGIPIERGYV